MYYATGRSIRTPLLVSLAAIFLALIGTETSSCLLSKLLIEGTHYYIIPKESVSSIQRYDNRGERSKRGITVPYNL